MTRLAILLLLAGCTDYDLGAVGDAVRPPDAPGWSDEPTDGAARIQVLPEDFDLGDVATACREGHLTYSIRNVGDEDLEVTEVAMMAGGSQVALDAPGTPFTLAPQEIRYGSVAWTPTVAGLVPGTVEVRSNDPQAPTVWRPLTGESCGDMDADGICDRNDSDLDGDGIANVDDPFPELIVIEDVHVGFDTLAPGTRVLDQYATLGVHFIGTGQPGQGYDTNVVRPAGECTSAVVDTQPNVLCTYVNDGFNMGGTPGLSGYLDREADAVILRLYNAGHAFVAQNGGNEADLATLVIYDDDGVEIGSTTAIADTSQGDEYTNLRVLQTGAMSFDLFTGDFDAVDDLHVLRLEPPECPPAQDL